MNGNALASNQQPTPPPQQQLQPSTALHRRSALLQLTLGRPSDHVTEQSTRCEYLYLPWRPLVNELAIGLEVDLSTTQSHQTTTSADSQ